ncbi:MAG: LapA family protein [Proteobacteria bacterium]|nr:LapA family protein [Pseudomonadota bacterium]
MRYVKMLLLLALFFLSMVMFAQNMESLNAGLPLSMDLFGTPIFALEQPVYLCLLSLFVLGGLLCTLYFLCEKIRLSRELSLAAKKIASLEQEVNSLRNLPLDDKNYSAESETTKIVE